MSCGLAASFRWDNYLVDRFGVRDHGDGAHRGKAADALGGAVVAEPALLRAAMFGKPAIIEQFDSLALEDFQQELECSFVDESYSYYPYDLILPTTTDELLLADDFTDIPEPRDASWLASTWGAPVGRSELAVFEETSGRFACRLLHTYAEAPLPSKKPICVGCSRCSPSPGCRSTAAASA